MKKISLILFLSFILFLGICIYYATQVLDIRGETTNIYKISDLIKIKHFPKGSYRYVFRKDMLTDEYSLMLYGTIDINGLKSFCDINSLKLKHTNGPFSVSIPAEFHKDQEQPIRLLLKDFYRINYKKDAKGPYITMHVAIPDGTFYAFIHTQSRRGH